MTKLSNESQIQENKAQNMKYVVRERKPIHFSWRFGDEMKQKCRFVREWHGEFESVLGKEENEQLEMFEGKLKRFKNWPILRKTRDFRDWIKSRSSCRANRQNTWKKTFEKISKCFSWLEVPLARESRTEPQKSLCTPHDWTFHLWQVANLSREKHETPNFWKIF